MKRLHKEARCSISHHSVDVQTMCRKFKSLLDKYNEERERRSEPTVLGNRKDGFSSRETIRKFCRKICKEELEAFRRELDKKMEEHDIDPRALQTYDEFNDFYYVQRKTTIVSERETNDRNSVHKNHCHGADQERYALTAAVTYGPFTKGVAMVMVSDCPQETKDLIEKDLEMNGLLVLIRNGTGNCHGYSHVHQVIPRVLARSAERARTTLQLDAAAKVLQLQDRAPGHCSNTYKLSNKEKITGLNDQRTELYKKHNLVNHLYSFNGTPEQCCNDHLHHDLKSQVHEEIRKLTGGAKDLTKMPHEVMRDRGGPLVSRKGYKRGPHLITYCLALSRVWARWPQQKLMATFLKLGYYTSPRMLELGNITPSALRNAIEDTEKKPARKQCYWSRENNWRHPWCDASGQPDEHKYVVQNFFENRKPKSKADLLERAEKQADADNKFLDRVEKLRPVLWDEDKYLKYVLGEVTDQNLHAPIIPQILKPPRDAKGALSHFITKIDHKTKIDDTNCHIPENFEKLFSHVFGDIQIFKKRKPAFMKHVMKYQLFLFYSRCQEKSDKKCETNTNYKPIWQALKMAQLSDNKELIVKRMVDDFQRFSLVPHGRKDPEDKDDPSDEEDLGAMYDAVDGPSDAVLKEDPILILCKGQST